MVMEVLLKFFFIFEITFEAGRTCQKQKLSGASQCSVDPTNHQYPFSFLLFLRLAFVCFFLFVFLFSIYFEWACQDF